MIPILASFLSNRDYDRFTLLAVLLGLISTTHFTRYVLPIITRRFVHLPSYRQHQLCVVVPTMLLRASVACLIAQTELHHVFHANDRKATNQTLDYKFNTFFFVPLCYLYELMLTPSWRRDLPLTIHHWIVMGISYIMLQRRSTDDLQTTFELYQIPTIITVFGMGPLDVGIDGIRLVYYLKFPTKARIPKLLLFGLIGLAWTGLLGQWVFMSTCIMTRFGQLRDALGLYERIVYPIILLFWAYVDFDAVLHFTKLVQKATGGSIDVNDSPNFGPRVDIEAKKI